MELKEVKTKSLKKRGSELAKASNQLVILEETKAKLASFEESLFTCGLNPLRPKALEILQINLGYMCNQTCEHCHVDAGPDRKEIMTKQVLNYCLNAIDASNVHTVDLTGGAPEMSPHFTWFVEELSQRNVKVIVRSNLTILVANRKYANHPRFFKEHGVEVTASLPCYTEANTDKQRGPGVFNASIEALRRLNEVGYGKEGTGLKLNLVFNPGGPSLPGPQQALEADYKRELKDNFDIEFNNLYTITNLPISRFLDYLLALGRYEEYMQKLVNAFNPVAAEAVMCRNTLSVGWDGYVYDCDFNQMLGLRVQLEKNGHIKDFNEKELENRDIVVNQHCYGCTAGAGSGCQGSLT